MPEDRSKPVLDDRRHVLEQDDDSVAFSAAHMSGEEEDYAFADDGGAPPEARFLRSQKRIPVRKGAVTKRTAEKLKYTALAAVLVAFLGCSTFAVWTYATSSWRFRVESSDSIETDGLRNVSRAQVLEVVAADLGRNVFRVPLDERKKQLEEIPWVESATVMRLWPARLRIHVQERSPVAFAQLGSKVMLIDSSGVLMELPPRGSGETFSFPVITGFDGAEPISTRSARMKIYAGLMHDLDAGDTGFSQRVSEADLSDPEDVKITVDGAAGSVLVHLGSGNYQERFRIYVAHVSEWRAQFAKLQSVDLRYNGQIIINPDSRGGATTVKQTPPQTATNTKPGKSMND